MLELPDIRALVGRFDPTSLTYPWAHEDPEVDRLQQRIAKTAGVALSSTRREMFGRIWDLAHAGAEVVTEPRDRGAMPRATVPYLNEPWYC